MSVCASVEADEAVSQWRAGTRTHTTHTHVRKHTHKHTKSLTRPCSRGLCSSGLAPGLSVEADNVYDDCGVGGSEGLWGEGGTPVRVRACV